jgi:AbrB family looped-hinge helix DNA binding protein
MGREMGEAVIDERGRIVIPREIREELNLRPEQRLRILVRGGELILKPSVDADEFISQLKGCVPGSKVKVEELKHIWGVRDAYHSHD